MKIGKREKGKIYAYRTEERTGYHSIIEIHLGETMKAGKWFCYETFSNYTGIKLNPGQMIEIEIKSKGPIE